MQRGASSSRHPFFIIPYPKGPRPMQLVVVMAVRKAVSAATITFTATSMTRFFIIVHYQLSIINCEALVFVEAIIIVVTADASRVDHQR